jgi:DNA primase
MSRVNLKPDQIESWVAKHFEYKRRHNGQELIINNPFDGDTKFKFNINTSKGVCHDWRPGHQQYDGPFLRFVQKYRCISFFEALREICGQGIDLKAILQSTKQQEVQEEPEEIVPNFDLPSEAKPFRESPDKVLRNIALNYLGSRGITLDTACKYNLHYGVNKIFFPYYEYGAQVYWQSRTIQGKKFDFPSLEETGGIGKEYFLYGFDYCEPAQTLCITESIIDAISLGEGAVASGGADLSLAQCRKVRAIGPSLVVLTPDSDREGLLSVLRNAELLRTVIDADIKFSVPPGSYKDWNQMMVENGYHNPRHHIDHNQMPANPVYINKCLPRS